ncbi:aminopeptidase n [Plakobranchus ocellatus]|uniref:Aminopeptidase n n=1 Tax=Plakobranchus ocellatus TaxID=259542 RepID=A0AAV3XVL5_9GAST|nr:aminopeptidase n [Plakobranchus ocellatus]
MSPWPPQKCANSLSAILIGRALDGYGRLPRTRAGENNAVKEALMKRYDLTEDGYCPSAKKARAGKISTAPPVGATKDSAASAGPTLEMTDNFQNEIRNGMLQLASAKAVPIVTTAALGDPKKMRDLRVHILLREIGVVVHKGLLEKSQLTGESSCWLRRQ